MSVPISVVSKVLIGKRYASMKSTLEAIFSLTFADFTLYAKKLLGTTKTNSPPDFSKSNPRRTKYWSYSVAPVHCFSPMPAYFPVKSPYGGLPMTKL